MSDDVVFLDFDEVIRVLDQAAEELGEMNHLRLDTDPDVGPGRKSNPQLAEISRTLLRVGEMCRLAGAEVYTAYYGLKGHPDPRLTREDA